MSDQPIVPVEQTPPVSDGGGSNTTDIKPENVPYGKYRDLLDEKKKEQAERRALSERLSEYEKREKEKEDELARKRGDYDKIIASKEAEKAELRSKLDAHERHAQNVKKLGAFLKTSGADIEEKWLKIVDLKSIVLDPDSQEVDQMSVAKTVEDFKKEWPEAFKKAGARFPNEAPNTSNGISGFIKASEYAKLSLKEMRKYKINQVIKD